MVYLPELPWKQYKRLHCKTLPYRGWWFISCKEIWPVGWNNSTLFPLQLNLFQYWSQFSSLIWWKRSKPVHLHWTGRVILAHSMADFPPHEFRTQFLFNIKKLMSMTVIAVSAVRYSLAQTEWKNIQGLFSDRRLIFFTTFCIRNLCNYKF